MVRTMFHIGAGGKRPAQKDAVGKVLTDITDQLGIKAFIQLQMILRPVQQEVARAIFDDGDSK